MTDDDVPNIVRPEPRLKRRFGTGAKRKAARLLTALTVGLAAFLIPVHPAAAQPVDLGLEYGAFFGLPNADIRHVVSNVIRSLLGFVGLFMVLRLIWSGFLYMTHGGSEEAYEEAVGGIRNAVIGLIIMLVSYSAANFIINAIAEATGIM